MGGKEWKDKNLNVKIRASLAGDRILASELLVKDWEWHSL